MRFEQRRQAAWNGIEDRRGRRLLRFLLFGALLRLELLPIFQHLRRRLRLHAAEDVRMPPHHLRINLLDDVRDVESAGFGGQLRVENDLQQQIA